MRMFALAAIGIGVMIGAAGKGGGSGAGHSAGLKITSEPDRVLVRWSGPVEPPMLDRFKDAFAQLEGEQRRIVISLNSPGGLVEYGYEVIAEIRRMSRSHTVDTMVESGRTCASMCVPIFLAGADRVAHPAAKFMFHEVSIKLRPEAEIKLRQLQRSAPGLDIAGIRKAMVVKATDEFYEEYFAPRGVNARWLTQMRRDIAGRDEWRTAAELVRQRSGVVDALR